MLTIPNFISLLRIPLALLFLQDNTLLRAIAIIFAMFTDILDGYFARRFQATSRFGTILDPFTDKFFVVFVLIILMKENQLTLLEACAFICRDFSVVLFGFYLAFRNRLMTYRFRAIWCGKVTTGLQFMVLLCLAFHIPIPYYLYGTFVFLGLLALLELYLEWGNEQDQKTYLPD
jgi:CDP-diacylglycerol---glycerol-3-phosphate 3-phosphatidyltransferase